MSDLVTVLAEVVPVGLNDGQCEFRHLLNPHLWVTFGQVVNLNKCTRTGAHTHTQIERSTHRAERPY